jgi:FtsH-binding integral membrane protein
MAENVKKMKPIWFFVGLVLLVMGSVILTTGVYDLIARVESKTVLARLHPNIWWGAIMVLAGLIFVLANKNATVE